MLPDEGDGYMRPKFDSARFYKEIDYSIATQDCIVRVDVLVDLKGNAKEIRNNSQCDAELFEEVKRVINSTPFTIGSKNGKDNEDWIKITVKFKKYE
jgi:hypothetical protein